MIVLEADRASGGHRIVLRPNGSIDDSQMRLVLAAMALLMGTIGVSFAAMGLWLVLPFSGIEWLLLAYCFVLSLRKTQVQEVITIDRSRVRLEVGRARPESIYEFQRPWVRLKLIRSPYRGHPSRLSFWLRGREVEVGGFLIESERTELARELRNLLGNR
ncbi:MAG: DUF2244 domain-containing protein [Methylococcaceae bacterium]|nr:DUF2244 domain-containing protein [Methylococcaceae bacterium]